MGCVRHFYNGKGFVSRYLILCGADDLIFSSMDGVRALEKAPESTKNFKESDLNVRGTKNRFEEKGGITAVRKGGCKCG